ncbi:hypothetical protein [Thermovibrio sp.]
MKRALTAIAVIGLTVGASAQEMVDPFVNPIAIREKALKLKIEMARSREEALQEVRLFKPKLKKTFDRLSIQGVIGSNGKLYLILLDPETGETYFLKEGDPIAPDAKIAKIMANGIVIYRYKRVKGRLVKEKVILNVDTEGLNNG